jgi:hypothetical protein
VTEKQRLEPLEPLAELKMMLRAWDLPAAAEDATVQCILLWGFLEHKHRLPCSAAAAHAAYSTFGAQVGWSDGVLAPFLSLVVSIAICEEDWHKDFTHYAGEQALQLANLQSGSNVSAVTSEQQHTDNPNWSGAAADPVPPAGNILAGTLLGDQEPAPCGPPAQPVLGLSSATNGISVLEAATSNEVVGEAVVPDPQTDTSLAPLPPLPGSVTGNGPASSVPGSTTGNEQSYGAPRLIEVMLPVEALDYHEKRFGRGGAVPVLRGRPGPRYGEWFFDDPDDPARQYQVVILQLEMGVRVLGNHLNRADGRVLRSTPPQQTLRQPLVFEERLGFVPCTAHFVAAPKEVPQAQASA